VRNNHKVLLACHLDICQINHFYTAADSLAYARQWNDAKQCIQSMFSHRLVFCRILAGSIDRDTNNKNNSSRSRLYLRTAALLRRQLETNCQDQEGPRSKQYVSTLCLPHGTVMRVKRSSEEVSFSGMSVVSTFCTGYKERNLSISTLVMISLLHNNKLEEPIDHNL
jgi:hypothetical protein